MSCQQGWAIVINKLNITLTMWHREGPQGTWIGRSNSNRLWKIKSDTVSRALTSKNPRLRNCPIVGLVWYTMRLTRWPTQTGCCCIQGAETQRFMTLWLLHLTVYSPQNPRLTDVTESDCMIFDRQSRKTDRDFCPNIVFGISREVKICFYPSDE